MKKLMFVFTVVFVVCAFAKEANLQVVGRNPPATIMRDWTPLSISLVTPVALPPGFWDVKGLAVGGYNWSENVTGLQFGIVNAADVVKGMQIGVVNVTRQMYGVQVGVVNVIQENDVPFLPIINCYF